MLMCYSLARVLEEGVRVVGLGPPSALQDEDVMSTDPTLYQFHPSRRTTYVRGLLVSLLFNLIILFAPSLLSL